jgi:hypothetical protein
MHIGELLHRRSDLSTFVVHLTKDSQQTAKENLKSIIATRRLEARSSMGWAQTAQQGHPAQVGAEPQSVVCFSETPLEHLYALFADIDDRDVMLRGYGLGFTKMRARRKGINPVWYVDRSAGADHQWRVASALDRLTAYACEHEQEPVAKDIGVVAPYLEAMGTWPNHQKEFWWEREWRHVGDMTFTWPEVALWFCPEADHAEVEQHLRDSMNALGWDHLATPRCIDPGWGLERIIARLVGLGANDVTPFRPH